MKNFFKKIKDDKIIFQTLLVSLVLVGITTIYILINYSNLPPFIPLFNQLPWGEQRLTRTIGAFIPPIIALLILLTNMLISSAIYSKSPLLSRIISVTTFLVTLLAFLFSIRTIQIVL